MSSTVRVEQDKEASVREESASGPRGGLGPVAGARSAIPRACLLAAFALAVIYAPILGKLARLWWTDTYAGHGMFVPLYSALILWMDRHRLRARRGRSHRLGVPVVLLALGTLGAGVAIGSLFLQALSFVVVLTGITLWAFGHRVLKQAAFPIGFLILMLPLPPVVIDAVSLDLRLLETRIAGSLLALLGVPSYQHGVFLELPAMTLEVAYICDGLRFLMALLTLTAAFAHVSQRGVARRLVLVAASLPIAILANSARVAAVGVGVYAWGPQAASGTIHHLIGKGVWGLTLMVVIALGLLLRRGGGGPVRKLNGRGEAPSRRLVEDGAAQVSEFPGGSR